jgi:hypothetical protein
MGADGKLYTLKGVPAGEEDENGRTKVKINRNGIEVITDDKDDDDNYRYNNGEPANKLDSLKLKLNEKQRIKDSLFEKAKEKIEKELGKGGENNQPSNISIQLPVLSPMTEII